MSRIKGYAHAMNQTSSLTSMLTEILRQYPTPPEQQLGLKLVLHDPEVYVQRTAYDMQLVIDRVGTDITVLDLGGGFGLFALGFAHLGARSILLDDFDWLLRADIGPGIFSMFEQNRVQVINRDVMDDKAIPTVDAIGLFHVMEHLHNSPKQLFHRCTAALKSDGVMVIAVPNAQNLRKRVAAPLGKVKWSTMVDWYEQPTFRAHVREPDVSDLRYIARDLGLDRVEIKGRNFLGMRSKSSLTRRLSNIGDEVLSRRPSLCSDIYLIGRKPRGAAVPT